MLKSTHHLSSVCHLAVLRYILTHTVNAIALDVTDQDVCNQVCVELGHWYARDERTDELRHGGWLVSPTNVLEGLAWHGDVSHTNWLDAVQGVPSRSGVSFEGFGEWEGTGGGE
ncbi:hypothetical protein B0H10DRAFT_1950824 [Mycena sp. CBHHK59/15]|nr:hypothetical protein B0H10DRAFT_1950824 [Mycena sp. CBHHK59/15]